MESGSRILEKLFMGESHGDPGVDLVMASFDMVESFIAAIDLAGNIVLMNRRGRELLGYDEEEISGISFFDQMLQKRQRSKALILFEELTGGGSVDPGLVEYSLHTGKGDSVIVKAGMLPLKDSRDNIIGVLLSGSDVTDVERSTRKLSESKEEAEELNLAKSEFLARVAHEIRTPLNAIMGFTEQLLQTGLDQRQKEFAGIIEKSSEHLLSLVNDVLILSKIEARELSLEESPFKLDNSMQYLHDALIKRATAKNLHLNFKVDPKLDRVLIGDSFRLRQILINLLNNAIKFTHQGSVKLTCSLQAETDEKVQVKFEVKDTGIGISPDKLEMIFEQFKQADSNITKKYGGTGLGLTICRNLIEMQNGSLSVTSQLGAGTRFTFTLPFRKGKESDLEPHDLGTVSSEKLKDKKVLLVDDDSVNRLLGKTILEKFRCIFDIANDGQEAMARLKGSVYDLILLDIHLPDISGIEVAEFLRKKLKNRTSKIIAVTAAAIQPDIQRFYDAGMNDFLLKPFKELTLFNKMCEVLKIRTGRSGRKKTRIILHEYQAERPFDLTELRKMAGSDQDFANEMLLTFIGNTEDTIHLMKQHLAKQEWSLLGESAHKILPSYRHLEVNSLVAKLLELKTKTIINPSYEAVPGLVQAIIREMEELISELKTEITRS